MLLLGLLESYLHGSISIFLNTLNLSNCTRTYFDNGAWNILSSGIENGCHSDFFS